ncbi:MAG: hypothetical protein ACTSV6_02435 [Candidatus Heimdallarchaeota archaeon]
MIHVFLESSYKDYPIFYCKTDKNDFFTVKIRYPFVGVVLVEY